MMFEQRRYTAQELLAWNRLLSLTLLGMAFAYAREREGSLDDFVEYLTERLRLLWGDLSSVSIEPAALLLGLSLEAIGAEMHSRSTNPEAAELIVSELPAEQLFDELENRHDVVIDRDHLLAVAGASQADLNRLIDLIAQAVAPDVDYRREDDPEGQRLTLRR